MQEMGLFVRLTPKTFLPFEYLKEHVMTLRKMVATTVAVLFVGTGAWAQDAKNPFESIREFREKAYGEARDRVTKKHDKNGDGRLSGDEWRAAREDFQKEREIASEAVEEELNKNFDSDGDGRLSPAEQEQKDRARREYEASRRERQNEERQNRLNEFRKRAEERKYDEDGDGKLSEAERAKMEAAKKEAEEAAKGAEKKLVEQFDADKDGVLNKDEMAKAKTHVVKQLNALKALVDASRAKKQKQDNSWEDLEKAIVGFSWFDNPADQMRAMFSAMRSRGGFGGFRGGQQGQDGRGGFDRGGRGGFDRDGRGGDRGGDRQRN